MSDLNDRELTEQEERDKRHRRNRRTICIVALLLLLLLLGLRSCTSDTPISDVIPKMFNTGIDKNASEGGLEGRSQEEIVAELNEKVAASMINISMNTSPEFENGSSEGNLNIVNNTVNNFPQVIEIYLQDEIEQEDGSKKYEDKELVYQSGMIPVGSKVVNAKLNKALESHRVLEKGTYKAIAYFNAVKEDGSFVGRAAARIKLVIKN